MAAHVPPAPDPMLEPAMLLKIAAVLKAIRPAVQADGGDFELVEVTPELEVRIRFLAACVTCPSSPVTLKSGIERNLKAYVPQVRGVVAVP